jgi:hypothetical protein
MLYQNLSPPSGRLRTGDGGGSGRGTGIGAGGSVIGGGSDGSGGGTGGVPGGGTGCGPWACIALNLASAASPVKTNAARVSRLALHWLWPTLIAL